MLYSLTDTKMKNTRVNENSRLWLTVTETKTKKTRKR